MSAESAIEWDRVPTSVELDNMLRQANRPGCALMKTSTPDTPGANGCWLGGQPTLPAEIRWPSYAEKTLGLKIPMHFLAQINLSSLPRMAALQNLPVHGTLFFFYDTVCAPLDHFHDGGSQVIYVPDDVSQLAAREMPQIPEIAEDYMKSHWYGNKPTNGYLRWNIEFVEFDGVSWYCFENHAFQKRAHEENMKIEQRMKNQMYRQTRKRSDPHAKISKDFVFHHMFGCPLGDQKESGLVRLLALRDDPDIHFEHAGDWIAFEIATRDLKELKFENVSLREEYR